MSSKDIFNKSNKIQHSPPPSSLPPPPPLALPAQVRPSSSCQEQSSPSSNETSLPKDKEYNCKSCSRPDNNEMVQCDLCDNWHHFDCVNVTSDIENQDWFCPNCSEQADQNQDNANELTKCSQPELQSNLPTTNIQKHIEVNSTRRQSSKAKGTLKSTSSAKSIKLSLRKLDEERRLRDERSKEYYLEKEKRDKDYLDAKYTLLEQQTSDDNSDIESTCRSDRLNAWVHEQFNKNPPNKAAIITKVYEHSSKTTKGVIKTPKLKLNDTCVSARATSVPAEEGNKYLHNSTRQLPEYAPVERPKNNADAFQTLPGNSNDLPKLSTMQIETRRIISKELPTFNGYAEEWPLFIASYENSSRACGFSSDENLIRLQRCLKGKALEAVRSKLMYPDQVPNIISTLRMMFGRPENVIDTLINKLRNEKPPRYDKLDSLITFALSVENIVNIMQASGLQSHLNNPSLLRELTERLPYQIRLNWGIFKLGKIDVNLSSFSSWLKQIAEAACEVTDMTSTRPSDAKGERKKTGATYFNATHENVPNQRPCAICKKNCKSVENCNEFMNMNLKQKWEEIKKNFLCRTCLIRHYNQRCTSNKRCGVNNCTYKHHKYLHKYEEPKKEDVNEKICHEKHCNIHELNNCILFKILPVTLHNNDIQIKTYAFCDDGSSVTLMDEELAEILQLKGKKEPLCLKWTSDTMRTENNSRKVSVKVSAPGSSEKFYLSNVRTVEALNLPSQSMDYEELKSKFPYLRGLPVESYHQVKPRILIGIDQIKLINSMKYREGNINQPAAIKTRLGWMVFGPCVTSREVGINFFNFHTCECQQEADEKLHEIVRAFFAVENIGSKNVKRLLSGNDIKATAILENDTKRIGNRFSVPLLWKGECFDIPDSRPAAERRMLCLEKKLSKNPVLAKNLQNQIHDYISKGYARKLNENEMHNEVGKRIWYLPIFPVINPNKPSKVRIVWDAAAKVNGVSLNSMLLSGPDNLPSLPEILFRFRQRRIAICGDIREMFHQVLVNESDQNAQRFLWRNPNTGKLEDYVMQVLTFGSTCSPCCAEYVKNKNALEFSLKYPKASEAIIQNHYVDDFLDSLDSEEEAVKLASEVIYIHNQGGFEIRNFLSNSLKVIKALGEKATHNNKDFKCSSGISASEKVLGLWWSPEKDEFSFFNNSKKFNTEIFNEEFIPTKREMLKILMSVFDPLGLISHFLILLKILLQDVWRQQTQWDEEIHPDQLKLWHEWVNILPTIRKIRIKRPYLSNLKFEIGSSVELHIFVDASMSAYAAAVYLRVKRGFHTECCLVCSRTKVGPIKKMSVPRMELEAAVLGTRLAKTVINGLSIKINRRFFWSDSQSVLCWIKNENCKVTQFVMFRVGEILENSSKEEWRWIPSEENPADDATKWNLKIDFSSNSRWYCGPEFLHQAKDTWPTNVTNVNEVGVYTHSVFYLKSLVDYTRFSSWKKLFRTMAQIYRFLDLRFNKRDPKMNILNAQDIFKAKSYLYRLCQFEVYSNEINQLKQSLAGSTQVLFEKSNTLYTLNPYLDEHGVMRIKGRIDASKDVSYDCKRPIILPKTHYITKLIIKDVHDRFHHSNFETVVNELRSFYYIPNLRTVLKEIQNKCQECKNRRAVPVPPQMGDLPPARLKAFTRPFSYVGVDYFGPILVTVGRHNEKRWGVIFTCLTVRAIHIEIAHNLSSDSCILAIQRFLARRGKPLEIWSDNGTNFRGADNELKNAINVLRSDVVIDKCVHEGIKWNFIPPASPHMGGSWERLIRSVKQTLAHMPPIRNPKDELLLTMMAEVEHIVNSRPLTYVPIETDSDQALTPNHFLIGSSSGIKLTGELSDDGLILRKNWRSCEQYANNFWKRWVLEYLPTLTRRTKWFQSAKPIRKDDIVIVIDENSPRSTWQKGRIIQVNHSKDGQTRSAVVQTATGVYTRPVAKLAILDVNRFDDSGNPVRTPDYQAGVLSNLAAL